jgi:type II pantothenate kinase
MVDVTRMIGVDLGGSLVKIAYISPSSPHDIVCRLFRSDEASIQSYFTNDFPAELAKIGPNAAWSIVGAGSLKHAKFFASLPRQPTHGEEMAANARGAAYLLERGKVHTFGGTGKISDRYIIASLGSGVSFTLNAPGIIGRHIGGVAVGGGTLMGLARLILNITDYDELSALARSGNSANLDLLIADIVGADYGATLRADVVASSMAKAAWGDRPADEDIAASLTATVGFAIGSHLAAVCTAEHVDTIVLIGGFLDIGGPVSKLLIKAVNLWHPEITVVVPDHHHHVGAIGAAVSLIH